MRFKLTFLVLLVVFISVSFFIDLPPGTILIEFIEISFPYSNIIIVTLINGIFFSTIIILCIYLLKRRNKSNQSYSSNLTNLDYELKNLLNEEQKISPISNLTEIKGIGLKRATELEIAGVKTISDLAKRSPQHLAEKTGIPITLISEWIIKANKMNK